MKKKTVSESRGQELSGASQSEGLDGPLRRRIILFLAGCLLAYLGCVLEAEVTPLPRLVDGSAGLSVIYWQPDAVLFAGKASWYLVFGGALVALGAMFGAPRPLGMLGALVGAFFLVSLVRVNRMYRWPGSWNYSYAVAIEAAKDHRASQRGELSAHAYLVYDSPDEYLVLARPTTSSALVRAEPVLAQIRQKAWSSVPKGPLVVAKPNNLNPRNQSAEAQRIRSLGLARIHDGVAYFLDERSTGADGVGFIELAFDLEARRKMDPQELCSKGPFFLLGGQDQVAPDAGKALATVVGYSHYKGCTVVTSLFEGLKHPSESVRNASRDALGELGQLKEPDQ